MIKKMGWGVKPEYENRGVKWMITALGAAIALVIFCTGCVTVQERQAKEEEVRVYEAALKQHVQAYVYSMSCPALLPLAGDYLWRDGYDELVWDGEGEGVKTDWKSEGEQARSRYHVHSHDVGIQACAVQFVRDDEVEDSIQRRRDPRRELEFLDEVDPEGGKRVRMEARHEAYEAYLRTLERLQEDGERWH